jgi:hypothetical protein
MLLDQARPSSESRIQWVPCPAALNVNNRTFQCGTLAVPLDYSNPSSNQTLNLDIIKIPALKKPKREVFSSIGVGLVAMDCTIWRMGL